MKLPFLFGNFVFLHPFSIKKMKKQIPNIITCLNLVCGCLSIMFTLYMGWWQIGALMIIASAVFDFFDGFTARLLHVSSPIGKDLDSLADIVSFGIAPSMITFTFMQGCVETLSPAEQASVLRFLPYAAFLIPPFSAYRLARFNHDERQTTEFRGLATPANALFIGYLPFAAQEMPALHNIWVLLFLVVAFSVLLVSDLPMFSLKFHHFKFKENEIRYIFLALALFLLLFFHLGAFPMIILAYILLTIIALPFRKKQ